MQMKVQNIWKHFKTISYHKHLVRKGCFKIGLYRQGLLHDLSKYSPTEFIVGVKYFQGDRSPNNAEREAIGYSSAWLHHKGRNKHHFEYWVDYGKDAILIPAPMPNRFVAEMVVDRVAASKVYRGKDYTNQDPLAYYMQSKGKLPIHPETAEKLEQMLTVLATDGEKAMNQKIRSELLQK